MNAPVTRRALLGATAAIGAMSLPIAGSALASLADPDAELFRLLDAWGPARTAADAADEYAQRLWDAFVAQKPVRPEALHVRFGDDFGVRTSIERNADGRRVDLYDLAAVADLRRRPLPTYTEWEGQPAPWNPDEQVGRWVQVPDERRIARRAEVLAAHDAWWAECDAVKDRLGLPAANEAEEQACDALEEVEAAILAKAPLTLAGLAAKARWASWDGLPKPMAEIWAKRVTADVVALAERGGAAS